MNVAIIIPAYNEEKNIERLLKEIKKNIKAEIVVVDDSINDLTKNIIIQKKINIIYIKRNKKLGRGSAVLTGIKKILKNKKIARK